MASVYPDERFGVHLPVASAKGSKLILEDGTEIIDAISSWG